jgi:hypothetical protein
MPGAAGGGELLLNLMKSGFAIFAPGFYNGVLNGKSAYEAYV